MNGKSLSEFKYSCKAYLGTLSIGQLRSYGRHIGVAKSTTMKKELLIDAIVSVLAGETPPIARSRKGAPVKNEYVEPDILQMIEKLSMQYLSGASMQDGFAGIKIIEGGSGETARKIAEFKRTQSEVFRVEDPQAPQENTIRNGALKDVYRGQLETINNVPLLLALNCADNHDKIIIPVELIRKHDLREGDIVSCFAQKSHSALVATEILTVEEISIKDLQRFKFEEAVACYPTKRIQLFESKKNNSLAMKYLHWLLPLGRGQRGCIVSSPKAGKTNLLYEIARSAKQLNQDLITLVVLIDQSPENVTKFRKIIPLENLVYSTYDDDADRQVFAAEFLLKRAKRLAECGKDVLLIVDSFSALANAFNQTNASIGGKTFHGCLESKTLQYMKKYFGAARCFEKGGSITMIGSVSCKTGNPADELIATELTSIDNWEIQLSDELSVKRIYPAIDFMRSQVKQGEGLFNEMETDIDYFLRNQYSPNYGEEALRELLNAASNYEEFIELLKK